MRVAGLGITIDPLARMYSEDIVAACGDPDAVDHETARDLLRHGITEGDVVKTHEAAVDELADTAA